MSKKSSDSQNAAKFVTINTYPKIGGGIPVCEGHFDFHSKVRKLCVEGAVEGISLGDKLIVVGDHNIGKTCLIRRYVEDQFSDGYKATIGVDFMYQKYKILDMDFTLHIWDTAGQEQFKCVSRVYFRGTGAVILAFDLGNEKSLEHVNDWLSEVRVENASPFLIFLVGLKSDAFHAVDNEMGQRVAAQINAEYWECSSKNNENVPELFARIAVGLFEGGLMRFTKDSGTPENQVASSIEINSNNLSNKSDSKDLKNKKCC